MCLSKWDSVWSFASSSRGRQSSSVNAEASRTPSDHQYLLGYDNAYRDRFLTHGLVAVRRVGDIVFSMFAGVVASETCIIAHSPFTKSDFAFVTILVTAVSSVIANGNAVHSHPRSGWLRECLYSTLLAVGVGSVVAVASIASMASSPITMWLWTSVWAFVAGSFRPMTERFTRFFINQDTSICNVAVLGNGDYASACCARLSECADDLTQFIGLYNDEPQSDHIANTVSGAPIIEHVCDLIERSRWIRIDAIILALPAGDVGRIDRARRSLRSLAVDIYMAAEFLEFGSCCCDGGHITRLGGCAVLQIGNPPLTKAQEAWKSAFDFVVAGIALVMTLPIFVVIAIAIKLESPGPVFFRQPRRGLNNSIFSIFKFRTMYHHLADVKADTQTSRGDRRVTRVGRWLRKTSLDELPQLLNVLHGEMSLIGPRPHAMNTKAEGQYFYDAVENYSLRYRVRPGITGWAQVSGWRGETKTREHIEQRVAHDLHYIENWSFSLDFKILVLSIVRGFINEGAF